MSRPRKDGKHRLHGLPPLFRFLLLVQCVGLCSCSKFQEAEGYKSASGGWSKAYFGSLLTHKELLILNIGAQPTRTIRAGDWTIRVKYVKPVRIRTHDGQSQVSVAAPSDPEWTAYAQMETENHILVVQFACAVLESVPDLAKQIVQALDDDREHTARRTILEYKNGDPIDGGIQLYGLFLHKSLLQSGGLTEDEFQAITAKPPVAETKGETR